MQHPKPRDLGVPNIDTPLKYQNDYQNFISGIFGDFEAKIDWLLEVIDGITKASTEVTHAHVDMFIGIINRSSISPAPIGVASWNNGNALQNEMETAMWVLQLATAAKLHQAAELDLTGPLNRMVELKLIHSGIVGDAGGKMGIAAVIAMLKWAKTYSPRRNIIRQVPRRP